MKLQARIFVVRKPKTVDITAFFKKFCITTHTTKNTVSELEAVFFITFRTNQKERAGVEFNSCYFYACFRNISASISAFFWSASSMT